MFNVHKSIRPSEEVHFAVLHRAWTLIIGKVLQSQKKKWCSFRMRCSISVRIVFRWYFKNGRLDLIRLLFAKLYTKCAKSAYLCSLQCAQTVDHRCNEAHPSGNYFVARFFMLSIYYCTCIGHTVCSSHIITDKSSVFVYQPTFTSTFN